jgi:hypothetical protein
MESSSVYARLEKAMEVGATTHIAQGRVELNVHTEVVVRASRAVTPTALALHTSTHTLPHLHAS